MLRTVTIKTIVAGFTAILLFNPVFANKNSASEKIIDSLVDNIRELPTFEEKIKSLAVLEKKARKLKYTFGLMNVYNQYGVVYFSKGELSKSDQYFKKFFAIALRENDTGSIIRSLNNRASVNLTMGYKEEALKLFQRATEYLTNNFEPAYFSVWYNIGLIYKDLGAYKKAIGIFRRILFKPESEISTRVKSCNSLGIIYNYQGEYDSALYFLRQGLVLNRGYNSELDRSEILNTMGSVYGRNNQTDSAVYYYQMALDIAVKEKLKDNELVYRVSLAEELIKQGKYNKANAALLAIQKEYEQTEDMESRANYYLMLAESYNAMGSFKDAVSCYTHYIKSRLFIDSVNNISLGENFEHTVKTRMASIRDSLRSVRQRENDRVTMVRQQETIKRGNERIVYIAIIVLVLIAALVLAFRAFRIKSKVAAQLKEQHNEIKAQKNIIQQKNAEVTDSINYARQLQLAILPRKELFGKYFREHSLLYLPKDIVAGDFYFFEEVSIGETTHVIFGVADCTGHGVPGAMVSVVCSNALHRAVNEFKLVDPGKILDKVRELVLETFEKSGGDVKDGMDISLVSLAMRNSDVGLGKSPKNSSEIPNPQSDMTLRWAGANNPLWILQPNGALDEIKPDKQPIGKFFNPKPFTTHTVTVKPGDTLVLFSDGYADQFGGPKVKKLKYSNFQKLLLENPTNTISTSDLKLQTFFTEWMGNNEQTDDVCVMIIKI